MSDPGPVNVERRRVLAGTATLAVGAVGSLAGCLGGGGDTGEPGIPNEPDYKGWFGNVSNYKNTKDRRNMEIVTVEVGSQANNGYLGFWPPAIAVSPGTEIVWDWTGRGGAHNVASDAGLFRSGDPVRGGDVTFRHTFDQPGVFKYVCDPHAQIGMRGAVFVALE